MPLGPRSSIEAARAWLRQRLHEGADCPVCTQRVQLYKRKLNSGMAKALIQIYRYGGASWTRVQDIPDGPKGGDYAKLRFWGLLESSSERTDDGNSAGYWRVTPLGVDFVQGRKRVRSHVLTFNNKTYAMPEEASMISVYEALGDRFDYNELMGI